MNVVILHQHFKAPDRGGAIRSYYLARALIAAGCRVTVLTGHNGPYQREMLNGIDVHWLPVAYDNRFGFTARGWSFLRYILRVRRHRNLFRSADLCYAISVPLTTGIAAMRIRKRYDIPYIFEVGDLWPDAPIELGFIRNRLLQRILQTLERRIYANASAIVALSPPIRTAIESRVAGKEVHLIPNMADTRYFTPEEKNPDIAREYGVPKGFVISYLGALGYANGLDYLLQCASACQKSGMAVTFLICGEGAESDSLREQARAASLANVKFVPFQNREGIRRLMNITDAVFVSFRPVPVLETGSPNKYFDGLAAGKLIVVNFGGWIREEIQAQGCGIYVDPHDPSSFVTQLVPFVTDADMLRQYQQRARHLAETRYSRDQLGGLFTKIILSQRRRR
ncbi:MAG TPA: glycosyltransferase family 4 protein [Cyclobacteriaceae bacterium]|nr:glycosyltransferase family 4 protein [Cyclobacteriaceae bacterium]